MSFDDADAEDDDALPSGPPPHPDDRLWRHPSEMGGRPGRPAVAPCRPRPVGARLPWGLLAAAVTATGAIVVGLGVAVVRTDDSPDRGTATAPRSGQPPNALADPVTVDRATLVAARDRVAPAVVAVGAGGDTGGEGEGGGEAEDTGGDAGPQARSGGSGVIVRADGIVVTSIELVGDGTAPVAVRFPDGRAGVAEVIGLDPVTGLAVLDLPGNGYPSVTPADPAEVTRGAVAITVGAGTPGGIEAAGGRVGTNRRPTGDDGRALEGVVAVTGAWAPGALGGPVVATDGTVLGVTTSVAGEASSYSAPVDVVGKVTDDILAGGRARHSWLGINGLDDTGSGQPSLGLWGSDDIGVAVSSVVASGPAAAAGLQAGDVIVSVGSRTVATMGDLVRWLRPRSPGDVVRLRVFRDGTETVLAVTLGELAR